MIGKEQHTVLEGRYELLESLGSGGAAEVYRAEDRLLGREVALKFLRKEYAAEPGCVERFRDEARSAASLSHPNVVQIYELGASEAGHPFVAMEYVEGGTLKDKLDGSGKLDPVTAARMAAGISRALQAAHAHGIIHRDIKPQNVLVSGAEHVKVADFGIACTPSSITEAKGITGTVRYMSPEQAAGNAVGEASDLYSLGAVFYEMLTGSPPFSGANQTAVALKHVNEPPRPPKELEPHVPDVMNELALKLLAKSPSERPADAGALVDELEAAMEEVSRPEPQPASRPSRIYRASSRLLPAIAERRRGSSPTSRRTSAAEAVRYKIRRTRRRQALVAVLLAVLLATAGWALYGEESGLWSRDSSSQDDSATPSAAEANLDRAFIHDAEAANISGNSTYLDIPAATGNPDALISVTQNWNPGGETGVYNEHPVGVWYDADREQWAIFNQDRAPMPEGASFNVVVLSEAAETA